MQKNINYYCVLLLLVLVTTMLLFGFLWYCDYIGQIGALSATIIAFIIFLNLLYLYSN
jgi:NADH:ubiquinone oxidoreductase subunit 3 (subunit A)